MTILIRTFMNSKIHRARVTESNLNYVGSITIDANILDEDEMLHHLPKVAVLNENNEIIEMINEKENTISNV